MTTWVDGGVGGLVKLHQVAYKNNQDYWQWHFLQAMNEAFCSLLTYKNVSIGCCPYGRHVILFEDLQSTKCLWEDLNDEEAGTHKGRTKLQVMMHIAHGHKYGVAYNAEYILLLYACWCCFFKAVAISYAKQVANLIDGWHMAGKATVEINKELTTKNVGASSCTILLFPIYDPVLPSYVTLTTQISLMASTKAYQ